MRVSTIAAALAFAALPFAGAEAMPLAQPIPLAGSDAPAITLTAGGCGIGFHRGFYGACRPPWGFITRAGAAPPASRPPSPSSSALPGRPSPAARRARRLSCRRAT